MYKNVSNLIDGTHLVLNAQLLVEILKEKKEIDGTRIKSCNSS